MILKNNIKRTGNRNLSKGLSTISYVWRKEADSTGGRVTSVLSRVSDNRIFGQQNRRRWESTGDEQFCFELVNQNEQ